MRDALIVNRTMVGVHGQTGTKRPYRKGAKGARTAKIIFGLKTKIRAFLRAPCVFAVNFLPPL